MRINLHKIGYPLLLVATLISYIETLYPLAAILKIAAYSMLSSPHHKIHIPPAAKVIAVLFSAALLVTTGHSQDQKSLFISASSPVAPVTRTDKANALSNTTSF